MDVCLHIGLHKTGTTFVQDSLKISRSTLLQSGIFFVPLNQFRNKVTKHIGDSISNQCELEDLVTSFFNDAKRSNCHTMILSDENLIGFPSQVTNDLYGTAGERLSVLKKVLASHQVKKIVLSVREYSSFYQSLFLEANKNRYISIERVNKSSLLTFSFFDIVREVEKNFPNSLVEIVFFEDFIKDNEIMFKSLTNLSSLEGIIEYSENKRISPSPLAYLESRTINQSPLLSRETKEYLHKSLMKSTYHEKIKDNLLFNKSEVSKLKKKYYEDCEACKKIFLNLYK